MESPSLNHASIVNLSKKTLPAYSEIYETAIEGIEGELTLLQDVRDTLRKRREFGLEKYGESSFEHSLENTLVTPSLDHAMEELLDCVNYLMHETYKSRILGSPEQYRKDLYAVLNKSVTALYAVRNIINQKPQ